MFFWNKFCGFLVIFFICSFTSYAQNQVTLSIPVSTLFLKTHENQIGGDPQPAPLSISSSLKYVTLLPSLPVKIGMEKLPGARMSLTLISFNNLASITNTENQPLPKNSLLYFSFKNTDVPEIPADYSTCQYGFFCREEVKIEKATRLPLRFRLGSLAQCNYYEGKP